MERLFAMILLGWVTAAHAGADAGDPLTGAVEPFRPSAERTRFIRAAGVDSELSREEFAADGKRGEGFVRSFDRWEVLLRFDADHNGAIDWLEAQKYRQAVHRQVLGRFDTDRDSKLRGPERTRAMQALAAGINLSSEVEAPKVDEVSRPRPLNLATQPPQSQAPPPLETSAPAPTNHRQTAKLIRAEDLRP